MSFIPTVNAIKVTIIGSILGQQIVIDITIGTPAAVSVGDLDDTADAIEDWLTTEYAPYVQDEYAFDEIKAYDMSSATAPVVSHGIAIVGGGIAGAVPNNVALVTSFLTANRGRSGRGRVYNAGLNKATSTQTAASAGDVTAMLAAWAALNSYLAPLGFEHVVVSFFTGGSPRSAGLKQAVTEYRTNSDWDSQRRRLAGRGR